MFVIDIENCTPSYKLWGKNWWCNTYTRLAFKKSLEPLHGIFMVLQLLKNFYSVLILHLLKPLFLVFHVLQALRLVSVLVNHLYIGDPLEANKTQEICIFQ